MASGKKIAGVLIAATIAGVFFMPFSSAVGDNTGEVTIDNETFVATAGETVDLDGYDIVQDSETVERYNESTDSWEQTTSGTDYEIDYGPGELTVLEGGSISDGDEIRVSYDYEATSGMVTTVTGLLPMFLGLLILVTLAAPMMDKL